MDELRTLGEFADHIIASFRRLVVRSFLGDSVLRAAIMQRAESEQEGDNKSSSVSHGFLVTKTLVTSPIIKQIFDVNMRNADIPDIIFIKAPYFLTCHANMQDHCIELHSFTASLLTLESTLPFNGTIRSAVPYNRSRILSNAWDDFSKVICSTSEPTSMSDNEPRSRDVILCTLDTGILAVVDWDLGVESDSGGDSWLPGLRVANTIRLADVGRDVNSLGHFIKVSVEYVNV